MRVISVGLLKWLRNESSNSWGAGRETMRATSILGLPVPAKQKSITLMTLSLLSRRMLPRLRSPWTSRSISVSLMN